MNMDMAITDRHFGVSGADVNGIGVEQKQRLRHLCYVALLVADGVAIVASFGLAGLLRDGRAFDATGLSTLGALLPLFAAIAVSRRVYCSDVFTRARVATRRAVTSLLAAVLAMMLVAFYVQASVHVSRVFFTLAVAFATVGIVGVRVALVRVVQPRFGATPFRELVIRDGYDVQPGPGREIVDAALLGLCPDSNDPITLDRVGRLLKQADRVVVACTAERRSAWITALSGANVQGEILMPELDRIPALGSSRFGKRSTLIVSYGPLDMRSRAIKRAVDLAFAGVALAVFAPLLALVALAVKLDSAGPVFFVQARLGRGNRLFKMYKFRSMRIEACDAAGARSTERGDDRVTRVGRLIRATSIDELPQLLNVLIGDMSVVGPRPHALGSLAGDKLFWEVDRRYWHRHAAKPGITGLAQVRGQRGATHEQSDLVERLQSDLEYINGWTIWRDLSILLSTARVVFHRNAY